VIKRIEDFPSLPGELWDDVRRRYREYRRGIVFGCPTLHFSRALQGADGHGHDYRDDLAAYPGDPAAYVTGPRSLARLIDRRKREGWVPGKPYDEIVTSLRSSTTDEHIDKTFPNIGEKGFRELIAEAKAEVSRNEDLKGSDE